MPMLKYLKRFFRTIGPGVITGAADDDPSGIATYSQTGAQFGYGQLWMALFMLPLMISIQESCARIAAVQDEGLTNVIKKNYNKSVLYIVVLLILIANIINIGADIGAMAASANLIIPVNFYVLAISFTLLMMLLEIFFNYKSYSTLLKWLCLSLIMYPITVFLVKQPWVEILKATFIPHIEFNFQFLFIITGLLGTTISPYMFFWQAQQTVEEIREKNKNLSSRLIKSLRIDTFMGMFFSEVAAWCMIVVTATVLHANNITSINTAADAAKAIEPLVKTFPHSGYIAKLLFGTGIIGLGLLSVPILAGSAAYALSSLLNIRKGLNLHFRTAKGFYGIIIFSMLIGLSINFLGINPIKALVYSAVINGVVAVPLIFIINLIANNKQIMGKYKSGILSKFFCWITFICMTVAAIAMFISFFKP